MVADRNALLVHSPEKIIYHIDVNSAFLSWSAIERLRTGHETDLRTIPAVVGGSEESRHGIVLAKSIPAKKYGIETGEPLIKARQKCEGLVVVPPDYELYVRNSRALMEILHTYAPFVQQYSIDEAFVDMTGTVALYGRPMIFAECLKNLIKRELGFTVNIGVGHNRIMAKMASDFKKPDRVHSLFPWEIKSKMWPLPVRDLFYVGSATERKLHTLGIRTIGQLAQSDPHLIRSHLKKHGLMIWQFANGIELDTDIVFAGMEQPANKGYGNGMTVPRDVTTREGAHMVILSLCETIGARMRADKAMIRVVAVSITDYEFHHVSRQMTLLSTTDITLQIYEAACKVFDQLWDGSPIRQLTVHTAQATQSSVRQYNLFDGYRYDKQEKLDVAIDEIRGRFGEDAVIRARFIGGSYDHMAGGLDKAKRTGMTKGV